ncbi:autotransporter-associated beta strand repeat-containing protein [Haloferula sp. BvORR071]|uniref:beta strand repeat-containing protein n=1 Tax=Haloferula sp. BvORR071 TaxID=1396141 RepID=UPI000695DC0D|nr:autotransporter-associated beta strand repeat-containing protein [Haloferula sp. BvORR071]
MTPRQALLALASTTALFSLPVSAAPLYWDGTDTTADADGGAGTWDAATTPNWDSAATAGTNSAWPATGTDNDAVFGGAGGAVTIAAGGISANDLSFQTTSYMVGGGSLTFNNATNNIITVANGTSTTISSAITAITGAVTTAGTGTLNLSGTYAGTGKNFTVSSSTVNLSSPSFAIKKFIVGNGAGSSPATLNLTGGTVTTSSDNVGAGDGVSGTINVQGGSLVLGTGSLALFLGTGPVTGTMNITSGSVTVNAGALYVGPGYNGAQTTASTGILTISGTGSYTHASAGVIKLTNVAAQTGTINLLAGGTFNINGVAINKGAGNATFNFDGGTLRSTAGSANLFTGGLNPVINAGGAIVDTNGFFDTISTNLTAGTGTGGLTKQGAGVLGLGGVNDYTGDTVIQGGNLVANVMTAIPNPAKVSVASGAGYGARLGAANVSDADFLTLMGAAVFAPGSRVAVDSGGADTVLTTNIGTVTNLGTNITLAKVGANTLTVDLTTQTFTGGIVSSGGILALNTTGTYSYGGNITGNQTLNIVGAGNLSLTGTSAIGQFNKLGTGTLTIPSGSLTIAANQNFYVHEGTFLQTGGTVNSGSYSVIGRTAATTGEYVINGGTFNASGGAGVSRNMVIAEQGSTGTLTINGGTVNATNSTGGSAIGGIFYGILMATTAADNATLNLNGGTLLLSRVGTTTAPGGTSTVNFNGGTLKLNNSFTNVMQGLTRANVRNGGAVIDTNGKDVAINQELKHSEIPGDAAVDGGLTKLGAGVLDLSGFETNYTGDTTVAEGTLRLHYATLADDSNVKIAGGATLDLLTADIDTVKTLTIGGVPAAVGTWGGPDAIGADFTSPSITGDGLIKVTQLATASNYDSWASANGLTGPDALATADPDKDGTSNLLEFALNGDPKSGADQGKQASSLQDASAPAGKELTLTIAVRDGATFSTGTGNAQTATVAGVVYRVEGSLGLAGFDSAVSHLSVSDTAPGLPSLAGTDWEYHTFKLDASEGLAGHGFLRVNVTAAP